MIAKMLGLDAATLAVADYEIIARIERIISSFNGGILPVQIQPVADQSDYVQHIHRTTTPTTVTATTTKTSSSSNNGGESNSLISLSRTTTITFRATNTSVIPL